MCSCKHALEDHTQGFTDEEYKSLLRTAADIAPPGTPLRELGKIVDGIAPAIMRPTIVCQITYADGNECLCEEFRLA